MEENVALKKLPAWREAVDRIREKFEKEGYGCFITDEEVDEMLSITPPQGNCNAQEYSAYQCARLQIYKAMDFILKDYDLCMFREFGTNGFFLVHPNDQVSKVYPKRRTKVMQELRNAIRTLTNLQTELLTDENQNKRNAELIKLEFARKGINKRLVCVEDDKKRLIEK